jgi:hypothetical protein
MIECHYCGEYLYEDTDKIGARCPRCREPLYERGGGPRLAAEEGTTSDRGACAVHPANVAAGTCQRCGNFICRVCRTPWGGSNLCLACAQRLAQDQERSPQDPRSHRRQAVAALVCGLAAWGTILAAILLVTLAGTSRAARGLVFLSGILLFISFLPAVFGVGQGVAAVRARGDRMILATCGLVLSASHLGVLSGLFLVMLVRF